MLKIIEEYLEKGNTKSYAWDFWPRFQIFEHSDLYEHSDLRNILNSGTFWWMLWLR